MPNVIIEWTPLKQNTKNNLRLESHKILFIIAEILFWQGDFFAVWLQIFLIYQDRFSNRWWNFHCCKFRFFSKNIVVNLAINMCDLTIMINLTHAEHTITSYFILTGPWQRKFVDVCILYTVKKDNRSPHNVETQSVCWSSRIRPEKKAWLVPGMQLEIWRRHLEHNQWRSTLVVSVFRPVNHL